MLTITAESASLGWDSKKKRWTVTIKNGAEVIHRSSDRPLSQNASEDELRAWALQTARDEGYEVSPLNVRIER